MVSSRLSKTSSLVVSDSPFQSFQPGAMGPLTLGELVEGVGETEENPKVKPEVRRSNC